MSPPRYTPGTRDILSHTPLFRSSLGPGRTHSGGSRHSLPSTSAASSKAVNDAWTPREGRGRSSLGVQQGYEEHTGDSADEDDDDDELEEEAVVTGQSKNSKLFHPFCSG